MIILLLIAIFFLVPIVSFLLFLYTAYHTNSSWGGDMLTEEEIRMREEKRNEEILKRHKQN